MAIRQQILSGTGATPRPPSVPRPQAGQPTGQPRFPQTTQADYSAQTSITPPPQAQRPRTNYGGSTNVSVDPMQYDEFREFGDSVMEEYQRSTAPEIEARRARVNQDLVNKGLTPGSEAYEREMDRFMRMENDLFQTAQRGALEQGLMAQNQAFTQGLGQANINAGLRQAQIGADASMYGVDQNRAGSLERLLAGLDQQESEFSRGLGQRQSEFDRNFGQRGYEFDTTFGEGQRQFNQGMGQRQYEYDTGLGQRQYEYNTGLDQRESEFGRTLGNRRDEFGRQMDLNEGQADFGNLASLLGLGLDYAGFNNNALANDRQFAGGIVGGFQPGAPFVPINAGGAFNTQLNAQTARQNIRAQNSNSMFGGIGSLGGALLGNWGGIFG